MPKHWHSIPATQQVMTASATLIGSSLALDGPWTVIRMLCEYIVRSTPGGTFALDDSALITVGFGITSTDAFAAGAGSMPDPSGEPDYPWLYWAQHPVLMINDPSGESPANAFRRTIDIRSMRKVKPRESLVQVVQYGNILGNPPMTLQFGATRVLVAT